MTKSPQRTSAPARIKKSAASEPLSAPAMERGVRTSSTRKMAPSVLASTKTQACLDLLNRKSGATLDDLMTATGWQAHSVRGFLSGTIKTKLGLALTSTKNDDGSRRYHVARGQSSA